MDKSLKMYMFKKIPTSKTIYKWFEDFIRNIESDIWDDYIKLNKENWGNWRWFYKTTYKDLLEDYSKHKKILGLKRNLTFEELCEFYNLMIDIYKQAIKNTSLEDPESLNKRTSLYHIFLKWDMNEVFKFKKEDNKNENKES